MQQFRYQTSACTQCDSLVRLLNHVLLYKRLLLAVTPSCVPQAVWLSPTAPASWTIAP